VEKPEALAFIANNHRAVLSTTRRDGRPALTPVTATINANDKVVVSTRETSLKVHNIERDPYVTLVAISDDFYGTWAQVEGPATILHLPEAMEPLVDYFRSCAGEHPNWDEYRAAMRRERRVLLVIDPVRVGPTMSG
jgi:PPOX class probable F420-dependent enzyme